MKNILIVDDDDDLCQSIRLVLEFGNYHVETAVNGLDALNKLEDYQPDLIVADYNMPGMMGDELCHTIKQNPKYKTIPFIFLTANNDMENKVNSLKLGAVDYITKPFFKDELLARVGAHLLHYDTVNSAFKKEVQDTKDNLLNNISHELRTPLTLMLAPVALMLEEEIPEAQRMLAKLAHKSGQRLKQVIENLIFLSEAQQGRLTLSQKEISIAELLTELIEFYNKQKQVNITLNLPESPISSFVANQKHIKLAVQHLIDNAIKFSYDNQDIRVVISVKNQNNELYISVKDYGIGLSPDIKTEIFDLFYQADDSITRPYGGLGAGLKITQIVAELHGGRVEISEQEEQGTIFTLIIPLTTEKPITD